MGFKRKTCDGCVHIHQDYLCAPKYCDYFNNMYIPYPFWMYCNHQHAAGEIPLDRSIRVIDNIKFIISD